MATLFDDLILLARQSAGMENDPLCADAEVVKYLQDGMLEWYTRVCSYQTDVYLTSTGFAVTSGLTSVPLPSDFFMSRGLDFLQSDGKYYPVKSFNFRERNTYHSGRRAYRIDSKIRLDPATQDLSGTYQLWYYPQIAHLAQGVGATLDSFQEAYRLFFVDYAAARMLTKAQLDFGAQQTNMSQQLERLETEIRKRDSEVTQAPDIANEDSYGDGW